MGPTRFGGWLKWMVVVPIVAVIIILLAAGGALDRFFGGGSPGEWGKFSGNPKSEWLEAGRKMKLLEDFTYTDQNGKVWLAPKGWVVDGASIPQVFWSITGGPLEGEYRNASVVHDVACDQMTEPSDAMHLMFYHACRCGGVPEIQAKTLYAAVQNFGPRWAIKTFMDVKTRTTKDGGQVTETVKREIPVKVTVEPATAEIRDRLETYIREHNPSVAELKKLDPRSL